MVRTDVGVAGCCTVVGANMRWRGNGGNQVVVLGDLEGTYSFMRDSSIRQSDFIVVLWSDQGSFSFVLCGTGEEMLRKSGGIDVAQRAKSSIVLERRNLIFGAHGCSSKLGYHTLLAKIDHRVKNTILADMLDQ